MYFYLWFKRFFLSKSRFIRLSPLISISSLTLAVASLVLAMSVYSGYEQTVKRSIIDMTGHLLVTKRNNAVHEKLLIKKVKDEKQHIKSWLSFLSLKVLLVHDGKLSGVVMEGIEPEKFRDTLKIHKRLLEGSFQLKSLESAVIGRDIAKRFHLKPGDSFHVVLPDINQSENFQRKHQTFYVEGIVDFGFYDFNSRYIITRLDTLQKLNDTPKIISGLHALVKKPKQIGVLRNRMAMQLGESYKVSDWQSIIKSFHPSYFHAVEREKFLIFFILMILIIAGAFNVSSHISISVLNQIREISILKVMGGRKAFIFSLFLMQGMLISVVGTTLGIVAGWFLSKSLTWIQTIIPVVPLEAYKVSAIITDLRFFDIVLIFICAQFICLLSCLFPCWRALKLSLREGLLCE